MTKIAPIFILKKIINFSHYSKNTMPVAADPEVWIEKLEENGYRLTEPLRAVVRVLAESDRILSPIDVYDLARKQYPKLGLVTVYRTIEKLEETRLVQRVHQFDGCNGYIAAPSGHQHLLICEKCSKTEYFSGDNLDPLVADIEQESGYRVEHHWLQLTGLCSACHH